MKHPIQKIRPSPNAAQVAAGLFASAVLVVPAQAQAPQTPTTNPGNSPVAAAAADPESPVLRQLLQRIEQLERREAARTAAEQSAVTNATAPLLRRINELEQRLATVEGAKVLPEIAVTAEDAPSATELNRKIESLDKRTTEESAAAAERARSSPALSIGASGIQVTSADKAFSLGIRGLLQADHNVFLNDNPLSQGNDGFVIRRVRLGAQGRFYNDFHYQFVPQFGGLNGEGVQLMDATGAFRPSDRFEVKVGKFRGPVGLEMLQPIQSLPLQERSMVSGLLPLRSIGAQVSVGYWDNAVTASAGVFNQSGDQRNPQNVDFNDDREFAGRVFFQPFKAIGLKPLQGLGFGLGGSYSQVSSNALGLPAILGTTLPGYYTSPGTQQFFAYDPLAGPVVADGRHWRLSPQAQWNWGPFSLQGEYALSSQGVYNSSTFRSARLTHSAWQVTGSWVLTGEDFSTDGILPKSPFHWGAPGWGAWQVVGRFSQFDVDDRTFPAFSNPALSATSADAWTVGINWWLNQNLRLLTSFTHSSFQGGGAAPNLAAPGTLLAPATVTAQDENLLSARVQISF